MLSATTLMSGTASVMVGVYILVHSFVYTIQVHHSIPIQAWSVSNAVAQFSTQFGIPHDKVILWKYDGHKRVQTESLTLAASISARPIAGDHIHMAMSIWINGVARQAEHDRPYEEDIPYEQKEDSCRVPGNVAYTKLWPHAGVHTHCDGIIHVHPWSAPHVLRHEGRQLTLGMWFDQVGIEYRRQGLSFDNGHRYDNNATHKWRVAEYTCFKRTSYTLYTEQFDRIWLGHAYGSYVVWYGQTKEPPPPVAAHILTLQRWGATGFDGRPYPQTCLTDSSTIQNA